MEFTVVSQLGNFADKTGRAVVRVRICMRVDKVELQIQLKIAF